MWPAIFEEYFDHVGAPRLLQVGMGLAEKTPLGMGRSVSASVARRNIRRMAEQFIVGATPADAAAGLHRLWRSGSAFTVDLLGEKTVTEAEADRYACRVEDLLDTLVTASGGWAPDDLLEFDDLGRLPRVNISIKPTALASLYAPLTRDDGLAQAAARLRPVLRRAAEAGAFVNFDMEHYDVKDLTLQLFRDLLRSPASQGWMPASWCRPTCRDAYADLRELVTWSAGRPRPVTVRLVKGAYWDAETIAARANGWPVPVFAARSRRTPITNGVSVCCSTTTAVFAPPSARTTFARSPTR